MKIVGNEVKFLKISDADLINNVMEHGFFEANVLQTAVNILKGIPDGTVLDIGANMGSFTIPLAFYNPQYTFTAFEPQRRVYYQLCANIGLNKLNNVLAHNIALGQERTAFVIDVPDYDQEPNIGAFSLDKEVREHDDYLCKTKGYKQKIDVLTLDSMCIKDIRLIKIDVEGMELDVLKGAVDTLHANKYPPILFEAWTVKDWFLPRRQELMDWLADVGYEVTSFGEDNVAIYKGKQ